MGGGRRERRDRYCIRLGEKGLRVETLLEGYDCYFYLVQTCTCVINMWLCNMHPQQPTNAAGPVLLNTKQVDFDLIRTKLS